MDPANLFLTLFMAASILSTSTQKNMRPWQRTGDGVTVRAQIFYDSTVNTTGVSEESVEAIRKPGKADFEKLFKKVQEHFHREFVMVNFTVESVKEKDELVVHSYFHGYIIAIETLQEVIKSEPQPLRNDSITYFFTSRPLYEGRWRADLPGDVVDYEATFNTFCNKTRSAAVVNYISMENHEHTVAATAWVFGEKKYKSYTYRDYKSMNLTFSHCEKTAG